MQGRLRKGDEATMCPVYHDQRRFVPERLLDPPTEVHHQQTGRVHSGRDPDGTTQRSSQGVFRRATSSGECAAMREKMKENSHPTGRDLSESEKLHKWGFIIWNGFRAKLYRERGMPRTSNSTTAKINKVTHSFLTLPGRF